MLPILVIGGTGFIGSKVVQRLVAAGHAVRCLVRSTSRTDRLEGLPVERVIGELRDADSVLNSAKGCRAIIHVAGISAWDQIDSPEMFPVVVDGMRNVLQAAREQNVGRVVFVSSAAALGRCTGTEPRDESALFQPAKNAGMTYVLAKREAERLCVEAAQAGLEVVIVRPAEVYGPGDRDLITSSNVVNLLKSSPVVVCAGGTSVVHVDDVADGIIKALDRGKSGGCYLLGGDNLHHRELAKLLLELTGRRWSIVTVPSILLRVGARIARFCHLPFPIPPSVVPYATCYWFVNNHKAQSELGLTFRSAKETLSETIDWLKTAGKI